MTCQSILYNGFDHTVFGQDDTALCSFEKDAKVILYRCLKQQLHYAHACGEEDAARELLPFRRPALGAAARTASLITQGGCPPLSYMMHTRAER